MEVATRDNAAERELLISAITSAPFLAKAVGRLPKEPFRSRWSNVVWGWCEGHFLQYRTPVGVRLESLFAEWAAKNKDRDLHTSISRLLSSLSGQYERDVPPTDDFLLDLAERYFNAVQLEKMWEESHRLLEHAETSAALDLQDKFRRIDLKTSAGVDVLRDVERQRIALEHRQRVLIQYPGAAGEFFGEELSEDSFVAVMASAKGGKSYTLLDMAWRAMRQGRKVAYFQVGDLSMNQIMSRFLRRAAYRPLKAKTARIPTSIILPPGAGQIAVVEHEEKTYETELDWKKARAAFARIAGKAKGDIRLSRHAIRTVTVNDIRNTLESWDRDGYVASVVVIDYAGNLAPVDSRMATHEQVGLSWALMRQLSEVRKCLVITANQSNKEGFSSWVLSRKNFSESKMILAHVTAFLGVNRTDEEIARGIVRYNFVVRREDEFRETYCLWCASYLDVANPIALSCLPE